MLYTAEYNIINVTVTIVFIKIISNNYVSNQKNILNMRSGYSETVAKTVDKVAMKAVVCFQCFKI